MKIKEKAALIILDGWGIAPSWGGNAITSARTPFFDRLWRSYPHSILSASGESVGLPKGVAGNSETGHINIGAGRIVIEDLPYINSMIKSGEFFNNEKILGAMSHVKKNNSNLHLMGLVGNGFVHSDINHLFYLLQIAKKNDLKNVYLDLFLDGRDSDPNSALGIIGEIERKIKRIGVGKISSVCGRFFAMDRDHNWGRTSRAFNALTRGEAEVFSSASEAISNAYSKGISDEFIEPALIGVNEAPIPVFDNDALIFFNFRPDRAKQISSVFSDQKIPDMPDRKILTNLYFLTFAIHDPRPIGIAAFPERHVEQPLAEIISKNNLKQLHIAETEKYAHVSYFLNGGREKPFPGETQIVIPSPKVRTYNLKPEMSAPLISAKILSVIDNNFDFIVVNYANADMVGHCGNFYSAVQAIEAVDSELKKLVENLFHYNYTICITADHGNAEEMVNKTTKHPHTEHTINPVPFILVSKKMELLRSKLYSQGILGNVAPTILEIMGISCPSVMTEKSLFYKSKV